MGRRSKKNDDDSPEETSKPKSRAKAGDARANDAKGSDNIVVDTRDPVVAVVMGSDSDYGVVARCIETLEEFDIPYEARVISAHRTPEKAHKFASTARLKGFRVLIAAAGGAAHLAGVMASLTTLPVIGIPIQTPTLGGADSLYSTVQMPAGVPVATVAIGEAGSTNAALLAAEILALSDDALHDRLQSFRAAMRRTVAQKNARLREKIAGNA